MREYIRREHSDWDRLRRYLFRTYGIMTQQCGYRCGGVVIAPPAGTIIEVVEELQGCHEGSGGWMIGIVPPGTYRISEFEYGHASVTAYLLKSDGEALYVMAGYCGSCTIDWSTTVPATDSEGFPTFEDYWRKWKEEMRKKEE